MTVLLTTHYMEEAEQLCDLRVYVDGRPVHGDPTALTLASHQEIVVAFGTAAQLPSPIPSSFWFPPGL